MLKKIFWAIILVFVVYILIIFLFPNLAESLGKTFGLSNFNNVVIDFKKKLDNGSLENLNFGVDYGNLIESSGSEAANVLYSGAVNVKDKVIDGLDVTKEKIDNIRESAKGVEEKYEETKNILDDVNRIGSGITNLINTGALK